MTLNKNKKILFVLVYFFIAFMFLWFSKSVASTENKKESLIQKEATVAQRTIILKN